MKRKRVLLITTITLTLLMGACGQKAGEVGDEISTVEKETTEQVVSEKFEEQEMPTEVVEETEVVKMIMKASTVLMCMRMRKKSFSG